MSAFISSSVNNDNLANLVVAAGILVITDYLLRGNRWLDVLAFAILWPLAALAKRSALVLIPIGFVAVALSLSARSAKRKTRSRRLFVTSVVSLLAILVLLVLAFRSEAVLAQVRSVYQRLTYTTDLPSLSDLAQVVKQNSGDYLVATFTSFWGNFGWLTIKFPDAMYWLLLGLTAFAMLGFVRYYVRALRLHDPESPVMVVYLIAPVVLFLAATLAFGLYDTDPTNLWWGKGALPQGRYLFPALIPIATLFMLGVREFIPARFRGWGAAAVIAILAAFNLGSLFLVVLPYFRSI
jgi:hypothetical protein